MKNKDMLILEYAKLASLKLIQGQKTVDTRMKAIEDELHMTKQAIMERATKLAIATFK